MPISVKRPRSFPAVVGPLRDVVTSTLALADRRPGDIAVVLERDAALRELNRRWRGIDRATDVLSFPYAEERGPRDAGVTRPERRGTRGSSSRIDGDLVISLDRVAAQSRRYRVTRGQELARLVIHGMLHLAGHDHHRLGERRAMRSLERRALRDNARAIARLTRLLAAVTLGLFLASAAFADEASPWLRDRGDGIATSLVGTYVRSHHLLVYPFYEYTINRDQEYKPAELGYGLEKDYRGQRIEHEALLLLTYGFNDRVAIELESAVHSWATLRKALDDPSAVPSHLEEDGFGDTQAELRWKWSKETATRPELFSYFEAVFPFQKKRILIGSQDWELVQGFGAIKGFGFGTLTGRVSASYSSADNEVIFAEYDAEYLKRLNAHWRCAVSVEGEQDELELIPEIQWHLSPRVFTKLNCGFGLTSKTPDFAPEVGVVLSFGAR